MITAGSNLHGNPVPGHKRVRMIRPEHTQPGGQHVTELSLRRRMITAGSHLFSNPVPGHKRVRMIRPEHTHFSF